MVSQNLLVNPSKMDLFRHMSYFLLHDIVNLYVKFVHLFVVFSTGGAHAHAIF